jgi:decaprenyl-phosphate phosphoribosyltransferase
MSEDPPSPTALPAEASLTYRLGGVVKTVRPHQWVKNVFVLAPVVFAKEMFAPFVLSRAAAAFFVFCLLAGAVYTMNDIADRAADRFHAVKRNRPIASGRVPLSWAYALAVILVIVAFAWALTLGVPFALVTLAYFALNVLYSFRLKHVAYLDVACISAGFVLRVVGGGFATHIELSNYLLLCTGLLALFLGFGKRRHELLAAALAAKTQRLALASYSARGLHLLLIVTGVATTAAYLAYTLDSHTREFFRTDRLWMSTGLVVLSLVRFLQLVHGRPEAESPTQEMLRDGPFVAIVLGWVVLVMWVVYNLRPA